MKRNLFILLAIMTTSTLTAQTGKQFTLDDLIPGGSSYYRMQPSNRYTTWWGEQCIEQQTDQLCTIDPTTGKSTTLCTLQQVNKALQSDGQSTVPHLYYAQFPYPDQPLLLVGTSDGQALVDWQQGTTVWKQHIDPKAENRDWSPQSRHLAYTIDHNLYINRSDGQVYSASD